jgi:hypothetical protein
MSHLPMGGQTEVRDLLKLIFSAQKLTSTLYLLEVAQFRGGSRSFDGSEHALRETDLSIAPLVCFALSLLTVSRPIVALYSSFVLCSWPVGMALRTDSSTAGLAPERRNRFLTDHGWSAHRYISMKY